ncbi:MAG: hypothetical protein HY320_11200 [Armatimonadetes bacterium]|nr:hypothetical protein [Armatimonadota bacterium]
MFGRVAFVGENPGTVDLSPSRHFIRKNLMLIGNWACCLADYEAMCDLIRRTPNVDLLISHRFPLSRVDEAFHTFVSRQAAKVLLMME